MISILVARRILRKLHLTDICKKLDDSELGLLDRIAASQNGALTEQLRTKFDIGEVMFIAGMLGDVESRAEILEAVDLEQHHRRQTN